MNKGVSVLVAGVVAALALVGFLALRTKPTADTEPARTAEDAASVQRVSEPEAVPAPAAASAAPAGSAVTFTFGTPKKAAHFESSTPENGSTLAAVPLNVVIDFNFDLAAKSSISVMIAGKEGKEYGMGATTVDANKLAMRRTMDATAPDGLYTVVYQACWPDGSCHDGQFQFAIDRTGASAARDLRGQNTVSVDMKDITFAPATIRISKGTTVTWTNADAVEHYVNTDAHPAHTYFPAQNSKALKTGEAYRLTFNTPGAYPYHCSAHADAMRGTILVE